MEKKKESIRIISTNKKAHFNYFLSEFLECGIALKGTEIKSLRNHGCSIVDSYIVIRNSEAEIINMHINPYEKGNIFNHDPLRTRKLLLHKKEIFSITIHFELENYSSIKRKFAGLMKK